VYRRGKWFGCFPEPKEVAGNPTFLTGYDRENVLEISKRDIGPIQKQCRHLDKLISRSTKVACPQGRKIAIAAGRIRERIQNLSKDLHNKTTNFLVKYYKVIFLPTFDYSQMVFQNNSVKKRWIKNNYLGNILIIYHKNF
jgi:putative transposase